MKGRLATGFTLIELIAVTLLISILGVVAFARLGSYDAIEEKAFYDDTVNAVRYAQKLAVSTGCEVQVTLSANGYALHQRQTDCNTGPYTRNVLNPANRSSAYQNSNPEVTISPTATIIFDPESTTNLADDDTFSVNGRQFKIYRHTGLVDAI